MDRDFLLSACLSFALEFEYPKKETRKHTGCKTEIRKKCPVEIKTTVGMTFDDVGIEVTMPTEKSGPLTNVDSEVSGFRKHSKLLIEREQLRQPEIVTGNSEEEEVRVQRVRKSARIKAIETRKTRTDIQTAVTSALRIAGSSVNLKSKMTLTASWKEMQHMSSEWLQRFVLHETFRKTKFQAFFLNGVNALRSTMTSARPRPPEVHQLILRFVVDFNKIYEIAQMKGVKEIIGTLARFIEGTLGKYLSCPRIMNSTHLPWIQTKQVLKLLLSVTMSPDSIYGLLHLLSNIQIYFLKKWSNRKDRDEEFISYAVSQIQFFGSILSGRLVKLAERQKYGFQT
uniref:Uncharacterized protein n=1 Tax=Caenorhabditis japonica TaxID=281687 RepID=A0A8R1DMG6_CAEJA